MQSERASKRQQELLQFVSEFITTNGYGPSYREIMSGLGYKSVSTVAIHVDGLIAKGYLARRDKSARSLEIVKLEASSDSHAKPGDLDLERALLAKLAANSLTEQQRENAIDLFTALKLHSIVEHLRKEING
jgi:SOS-response transcriptional repressor LexA